MLYDLMDNKNVGVNSLRSAYASYWLPKCNSNQIQRISWLMRTSSKMLYNNYVKKSNDESKSESESEDSEEEATTQAKATSTPKTNNIKLTNEEREKYKESRLEYYKTYYEHNKEKLKQKNAANDKQKYYLRYVRELNQNKIDWCDVKDTTKEKYKLFYDEKLKKYSSKLET